MSKRWKVQIWRWSNFFASSLFRTSSRGFMLPSGCVSAGIPILRTEGVHLILSRRWQRREILAWVWRPTFWWNFFLVIPLIYPRRRRSCGSRCTWQTWKICVVKSCCRVTGSSPISTRGRSQSISHVSRTLGRLAPPCCWSRSSPIQGGKVFCHIRNSIGCLVFFVQDTMTMATVMVMVGRMVWSPGDKRDIDAHLTIKLIFGFAQFVLF